MTLRDVTRAVRTRQWFKNVLIFGGFIFAGRLRGPLPEMGPEALSVLLAFGCFCGLSGAAYIINDWRDLENDRRHPIKKDRPMASGRVSLSAARALIVLMLLAAVACGAVMMALNPSSWGAVAVAGTYFLLTLAYSAFLKHEVIIDVLCVAAGFVLRVMAGCLAIPVEISPWIIFCTFTLALFVALCKRRAELLELGDDSGTRRVLKGYNLAMLDTFIAVASGLTITAYSLYTFNVPHPEALGRSLGSTPLLMTSIPFVVYGVFRFLFLAHSSPVGGEPEQMLRDRPMVLNVLLWILWVAALSVLDRGGRNSLPVAGSMNPAISGSSPATAVHR